MTVKSEEDNKGPVSKENNDTEAEYSDLYPGRRKTSSRSWYEKIFLTEKREEVEKTKCEVNVYKCVIKSPIIKLMLAALKSSGCEIDLSRHITCEVCSEEVTGGYDPQLNQIIVCQNTARDINQVQVTLSHEMIHMFDYCRNKLDLNNLDHLACTEIRAANLCHCSFRSAVYRGFASPFNIRQTHRNCVIDKAIRSVTAVKNVSPDVATESVMRVFDKCYNDLEPIGRRIRKNSKDMEKAYCEAPLYGYSD